MGLAFLFLAGTLLQGRIFLSLYNQVNVLGRISIIALPSIGMTLVVLTAGIDLSVGSMVSLSSVVCAMLLMERSWTKATSLAVPLFLLFLAVVLFYAIRQVFTAVSTIKSPNPWPFAAASLTVSAIIVVLLTRRVDDGLSTLAVLCIVPSMGMMIGAASGLIIARGKIQPFIVTLGMMSAAVGLAKFIAGKGGQIHPVYYQATGYAAAGTQHTAPASFDLLSSKVMLFGRPVIPIPALFFLAAVLILHFALKYLRTGRYIYAIGGNEETARLSGIRVERVKIMVYGISGFLSAMAGVLYCSAYTQGKPDAGATWELDAIAAAVIGGCSLMGGRGTVLGTMVGVFILGYLSNILNLQEVPSEVQDILKGAIIIIAVLLQEGRLLHWMRRMRKSKH